LLDLLESWKYRQLYEYKEAKDVNVKIIFTTNIDIEDIVQLSDDMKNRLRSRCLTIPHLSALSYEERKEELTVFIRNWCAKENTVITPHGWELLLRLDLSKGAYRFFINFFFLR